MTISDKQLILIALELVHKVLVIREIPEELRLDLVRWRKDVEEKHGGEELDEG